jgi:hypothetical protein
MLMTKMVGSDLAGRRGARLAHRSPYADRPFQGVNSVKDGSEPVNRRHSLQLQQKHCRCGLMLELGTYVRGGTQGKAYRRCEPNIHRML